MTATTDIFSDEIWKWVPGFEGFYSVSNLGSIRNSKGKILSVEHTRDPKTGKKTGHLRVTLHKNGKQKHCFVHRLVALAFIPNPDNKPYVNHKDNDPENNCVDNLEWCTNKENVLHSRRSTQPKHKDLQKSVVNLADGMVFKSIADAAREYGITVSTVKYSCETKSAMMKMDFRYLEDRPEFVDNLFMEAPVVTRCGNCGNTEGLIDKNGSQNKFCGKCGAKLNWLKEPSSHEV